MTFESRIIAFSERFLSDRTFQLVVAPALADLEFEPGEEALVRAANRFAVIRAVAGALAGEVRRECASFLALTLLPACYYVALLAVCFGAFTTWSGFFALVALIVAMSAAPVMVCFWPSRRPISPAD